MAGSLWNSANCWYRLPTIFAELFVNYVTGFSLGKLHAFGYSFALLRPFFGILGRCRSRDCFNLLGKRSNLFFPCFDDGLMVRLCHIFGHDKSRGNKSPIAIYLHEPNRKVIGHREEGFGVLHGSGIHMDSVISGLTKRI